MPRNPVARVIVVLGILAVLGVLAVGAVAATPTALGERLRNAPMRVQARFLPHTPPPVAFIPTPAVAAEEQAKALALLVPATPVPPTVAPTAAPTRLVDGVAAAPPTATRVSATPTRAATATPSVQLTPVPGRAELVGLNHEYQGWNNCGPATIGMDLSYFGKQITQKESAPILKPDPNDKNVGPDELAAYAQSLGMGATYRVNGNIDTLKKLLANDLPVIVEHWFIPEPNDEMGHYKLMRGFDDASQSFIAHDSYNGPNIRMKYDEFDSLWKVFNRTYVVVYPPEKEAQVKAILGDDLNDKAMWEKSLAGAQTDVKADPNDKFAWFNLGSSLEALGRHEEASRAFDQARRLNLPWRMLWYQFAPFEAYLATQRYQDVLSLADANLKAANNLEESHYYRGLALKGLGQPDQARQALEQAVKLNKNFQRAQDALSTLALSR